jgi:cysteine desulfurase/selenocysteine lyase
MSMESYWKYFPICSTDIYFNHAAVSPFSTNVVEAMQRVLKERSSGAIEIVNDVIKTKKKLKINIAQLIDGKPENIAIIGNTSEGLNWLVQGLEWKKGDRVLLVDQEFPANIYPFLNLERKDVIVDFVPVRNGFVYTEDIEKKIYPGTKLLSISFVGFLNGFRNHLDEISEICQRKNILLSVDGIQGVGALPLSVRRWGIDFLSNGGHKWLMGPQGCGFMYIAPTLFDKLKPAFAGWLSVKDSWNFFDYRLDFLDDSRRFEIATPNVLGIYGLTASTELLLKAGMTTIEKHLLQLGNHLIEKLSGFGFEYIGSRKLKERSGIYSFRCKNVKAVFDHLQKNRIHLSLRNDLLRFSPHFYNTPEEVERIAVFLKQSDVLKS